jgi:integrase
VDNPARGVDLPTLRTVRPKWALTTDKATALLETLPLLGKTMVGLAVLSGLRRGELFALRWKDVDGQARMLTVRESVYDGTFSTPKTVAGARQIPLSTTAAQLMGHANVDRTLNVYTQVLDGSLRAAADRVGSELFTIVHKQEGPDVSNAQMLANLGGETSITNERA